MPLDVSNVCRTAWLGEEEATSSPHLPTMMRGHQNRTLHRNAWTAPSHVLAWREIFAAQHHLLADWFGQRLLPSSTSARTRWQFRSRVYCGEYSADGRHFLAATQDFHLYWFDCSAADEWRLVDQIVSPTGQWSITDACLDDQGTRVAFSSIASTAQMACLGSDGRFEAVQSLPFDEDNSFGIWSLRFSKDGYEMVAGTSSSCIYAMDLTTLQVTLAIAGHEDDVNAVHFADESKNIILSGSDDSTIKVWDRRSMAHGRPAGVLIGHTEGITSIASLMDGRHCLSNSKDQSMKLWDLRAMSSWSDFQDLPMSARDRRNSNWDYRFSRYPNLRKRCASNPDCSITTYQGHHVLRTLIRCRFSPTYTTHGRFVYTGSADGHVYIYHLDGRLARRLAPADRKQNLNRPGGVFLRPYGSGSEIRDCCWHPNEPTVVASSWTGRLTQFSYVAEEFCPTTSAEESIHDRENEFDLDSDGVDEESDEPVPDSGADEGASSGS